MRKFATGLGLLTSMLSRSKTTRAHQVLGSAVIDANKNRKNRKRNL